MGLSWMGSGVLGVSAGEAKTGVAHIWNVSRAFAWVLGGCKSGFKV